MHSISKHFQTQSCYPEKLALLGASKLFCILACSCIANEYYTCLPVKWKVLCCYRKIIQARGGAIRPKMNQRSLAESVRDT